MQKISAGDPETRSADIVAENVEQLKALFPEAVTEGKVDFEVLRQLLGDEVDDGEEKYGLNWHGKRRARRLALTPSIGTLRPCPEDSVDWDTTQNLMIEGDNLEVLKLLQKSYSGKVKLIYIDPPYNTGKDFIYSDNYQDNIRSYLEITRQTDDHNLKLSSNVESSGRFHTNWLNMMYPRLFIARNLLSSDGAIFMTIGDEECANLIQICKDIFGEENFYAHVIWQKKYAVSQDDPRIASMHDHIIVFSKSSKFKRSLLPRTEKQKSRYKNPDNDHRGPWSADNYISNKSKDERPTLWYPIVHPKTKADVWPKESSVWRYSKEKHEHIESQNRLYWGPNLNYDRPRIKKFLNEVQDGVVPSTWWPFAEVGHNDEAQKEAGDLVGAKVFSTPKPLRLMERVLDIASEPNSLVMDFFAGSGSFGHAVFRKNSIDLGNRRFIIVQLPEPLFLEDANQRIAAAFCDRFGRPRNIAEATKERLHRASRKIKGERKQSESDLGFRVFKLDTSNIRPWDLQPDDLEGALLSGLDHIVEGRTEQDILYELLLKLGLDLCAPIETQTVAGKSVHSVGAGTLIACLDESISRKEIEPLALGIADWYESLVPAGESTVVFRDSAFADDVAKANLAKTLKQCGLRDMRSL